MGALDRYIFRTTFGAFLLVLISLTTVIWLTHALREIDLMTNQKQTVLVFLGITGLLIPMLMLVIAPIALVVAIGFTLNRLNADSEIVVMNAAGMSPWRIFRPFLLTTL
ncbi:MAG: lipopolysaccharide export system permease protein, partial [Hyphomicrobiales bacterium]|nr:lipopolysaccharide export system permease protein [Hyphomicrobiales bacterium]